MVTATFASTISGQRCTNYNYFHLVWYHITDHLKKDRQFQRTIQYTNADRLQLIDTITNSITSSVPIVPMDQLSDTLYTCIIPFGI